MNCHIKAVHILLNLLANSVGDGLWEPKDGLAADMAQRIYVSYTPSSMDS